MTDFDTIVIGSGPGGYVSAIKSSQLGAKTAIIEKYNQLGGVCLNVGCIPSKALLNSSDKYHELKTVFNQHGIVAKNITLDWQKMQDRKNKVISENNMGIKYLMKKNKITTIQGHAKFVDKNIITLNEKKDIKLSAKNFIIATGSKPVSIPGIEIDKKTIISSTECISLKKIPKTMIIIGGGVIGIELGSVYARLGCEITVIEFLDEILTNFDKSISKELRKILGKIGIKFYLQHKVKKIDKNKSGCKVIAEDKKNKNISFNAECCLMAVGRKAYHQGLNLEAAKVEIDKNNFIKVNQNLQTSNKNIYAIGDVIGGAMLAHKAEEEAIFVSEVIAGQKPTLNHLAIPSVVYTSPEAASIGLNEQQCKDQNIIIKTGNYPISALGRARATGEIDGFIKIITDKSTDQIIGAHILCVHASDLIAELAVAYSYKASAEDIARISHPHPSFSEGIKEAAMLAWLGNAINL